jgi:hypothetical protein
MSVILQNSFSSSNLSHNVDNGDGGSLVVAVAAWQWQRQWQWCGGSGSDGSSMITRRWRQQRSGSNSIAMALVWRQQRGSMVVVAAAAQRWWWRQQCCAAAAWQLDGGNIRMRCYEVFMVEVQNM